MIIDRATAENLVGTKISNIDLYQKAFTHKSALKEDETLNGSFETLEFIGDSVLGFVITKFLYDKYENRQEGFLTKARTKLVRGETLDSQSKDFRRCIRGTRRCYIHGYGSIARQRVYIAYLQRFIICEYAIDHG